MAVSDEEVYAWLWANPEASDIEIAQMMQQHGVSPRQVAGVLGMSVQDVTNRFETAMGQIEANQPTPPPPPPPTGQIGAEQAYQESLESALATIQEYEQRARQDMLAAQQQARGDVQSAIGQGREDLRAYREAGEQALSPQLALSGALGQEAFDQAYTESPYMSFLQEQGDRAVTRNAAALGGLGGGDVLKELTRFGQGLSGQGLQQQIGNLANITGMGAGAAGQSGALAGQGGTALANIGMTGAGQLADITGTSGAMQAMYGMQTGGNIAAGRQRVGELTAGQIGNVSAALGGLANQQGGQISDILGAQSGNLAGLLQGAGLAQADIERIIAMARAQAGQTASGQYMGQGGVPGVQQTPGYAQRFGEGVSALAGGAEGVGTATAALQALSDVRLKENIQFTHSHQGLNFYSWDWKPEYRHITMGMPETGVLAQEVMGILPEAVFDHPSGFLGVDYGRIYNA